MQDEKLKPIEERLDKIIALLKVLVGKEIEDRRRALLSTPRKKQIYELCDGTHEMSTIANMVSVSGEYVRLTIKDLEDAGLLTVKQRGKRRYPMRTI
jgi:DNA-binding transcriptional ArsR family regulator